MLYRAIQRLRASLKDDEERLEKELREKFGLDRRWKFYIHSDDECLLPVECWECDEEGWDDEYKFAFLDIGGGDYLVKCLSCGADFRIGYPKPDDD